MKTNSMNVSTDIEVFQIFSKILDEKDAKTVLNWVENKPNEIIEDSQKGLATKSNIFEIKQEISKLSLEIAKSRTEQIIWTVASFAVLFIAAVTFLKFIK